MEPRSAIQLCLMNFWWRFLSRKFFKVQFLTFLTSSGLCASIWSVVELSLNTMRTWTAASLVSLTSCAVDMGVIWRIWLCRFLSLSGICAISKTSYLASRPWQFDQGTPFIYSPGGYTKIVYNPEFDGKLDNSGMARDERDLVPRANRRVFGVNGDRLEKLKVKYPDYTFSIVKFRFERQFTRFEQLGVPVA